MSIGNFDIFTMALGLSMDAFAVAVANGFSMKKVRLRDSLKIGAFFGGFQALMPILGYLSGLTFKSYISAYAHWIAFVVLAFIGGKMIYESHIIEEVERDDEKAEKDGTKTVVLLGLAIATSIDALAVGITLALMVDNIIYPSLFIGGITFALSFAGVYIGKKFGNYFENKIEIIGGAILILIGLKILLEKLFF